MLDDFVSRKCELVETKRARIFELELRHEMSDSSQHLRLALTVTHLLLVALGSLNVLVIFLILSRPYLRSITNVYMVGLCLADFIYLTDLSLVAATSLNLKSWPFGSGLCHFYHGTETTGKYASVLFVVLLAADRYLAMCKTDICARFRNYRVAMILSTFAWVTAIVCSLPLYLYAKEATFGVRPKNSSDGEYLNKTFCLVHWPSTPAAQWYITTCSVLIFILPVLVIFYCYYQVFCKLREAAKGSRRLQRSTATRAPYQRVTRSVQRVVLFHLLCWTPFWLFNLFSSIFRVRITSQLERIVVNIIHLFPYVNCALNPLLYAYRAENFRIAFKSMFMFTPRTTRELGGPRPSATRSTYCCSNNQTAGDEATKTGLLQKRPSSVCQDEANGGKDRVRSSTDETWRTQSVTDNPLRRCVKPGKNEKAQGASLHVRFYPQKPVTQNIILPPSKEDRQDSITLL
ncbi:hypothetical protein Y032_0263g603 [Ancylostoma ceylanicum]|uniref:G-protein coupled receptors family 1 profile domain-containing protein n=1 Tax=Ancylostoma ceylanicum TaxID=53326 RepID=A0A016SAQ6_9BILA|nr:hypothetical protein Y032_0263g603 [Ancylostoma ceylanicum]